MFVVLLKFAEHRARAKDFMEAHNQWLRRGFDDGAFVLAGSLKPGLGGAILARSDSREALQARVEEDPFVSEGVVSPELLEIDPARADQRLDWLVQ